MTSSSWHPIVASALLVLGGGFVMIARAQSTTRSNPSMETKNNTGNSAEFSKNEVPQAVRYGDFNVLNEMERYVLLKKGTERAGTGKLTDNKKAGTYLCRRCNAVLFRSADKFNSRSGWPSFDDEIKGSVQRKTDADGQRTEILCQNCGGHLGHVFTGEGYTPKNTRHCVNSVSMSFVPEGKTIPAKILPEANEPASTGRSSGR